MFENDTRLDDIMKIFKRPPSSDEENKTDNRVSEAGIRYFSRQDIANDNIRLSFQGNFDSEALK